MRFIWLISFISLFSYCQQPPAGTNTRTWTVIKQVTAKNESIADDLMQLRDKLQESVQVTWGQTTANIYQKGNDIIDQSRAAEFSCIIDTENDAAILSQLVEIQKQFETMLTLEDKLEKQEIALTHQSEKILKEQDDAITHVEIMLAQEDLFKAMVQLMYQQTIRRHQKLSKIRGMIAKLPKK